MKILILSNHLNIGGITRYVFLLAKGLVELKNKVWVVGRGELEEEIKNVGEEVINIDLKIKSELSWRIIRAILKLRKYFYKENPEIIHANTRTNSIIAHYLSRIFNIPYITTCHGLYKIRFSRRAFPFLGEYTIAISRNVRQQLLEGL
ncbi:MAG: glycosyltransferase, partial [Candidatus Omnitrophica bacterium]|nr:glycosyltransferase [Candidatus Omnitrophota bacterium]